MTQLSEDIYLPNGWSCREISEEGISFARQGDRFTLAAELTTNSPQPSLDYPYAWMLTYRQRTDIAVTGGSIGFVTTKDAAIEGLISCMRQISSATDRLGTNIDLHTILDDINLSNEIPSTR